ncbi:hypothetical protein ACHMW4_20525 [Mesorhizobium sp. UC22_110]|uniref:hypothetical protein n=1 Tax=unclassified Mesorhizobium TaxID=325217 RepID=UPI0036732BDE
MSEAAQFEKSTESADASKREQSSIAFPYLDLDAGVEVSRAIYRRAGLGSCAIDELAAEMGQVVSGALRLKTGTARIFDLTTKGGSGGGIQLSDLGRLVVSPETERAARAEAFMRVPLYAAIYESYRGHLLPPMKALEREMQKLGVSSKQTDKARQAFERSARQAGYFESGEDRLVRPKAELPTKRLDDDEADRRRDAEQEKVGGDSKGVSGKSYGGYHPFIEGLLSELPEEFNGWSVTEQAEWLRAAASIFKLLSKTKGRISIKEEEVIADRQ